MVKKAIKDKDKDERMYAKFLLKDTYNLKYTAEEKESYLLVYYREHDKMRRAVLEQRNKQRQAKKEN